MVIGRLKMKRKRRDDCPSPFLDDSPKRTKVHAQRKFAQGSNVNSPVITPVKEIERQEIDVLPEPVELLPMKRPNTEDFLTFLCFRGTPILPPSLNFFNTASIVDTNGQVHEIKSELSPKNGPIDTIGKTGSGSSERPFIAFGVRKRADPIVISRQMDKKRRHALALQALRRKYQEQRMAKIRAVAIDKLSEKVTHRSNSVPKTDTIARKATIPKTKVTSEEKMTTRSVKTGLRAQIKPKMCLRSFRGRFVQKELQFRNVKKRPLPVKKLSIKNEVKEKEKSEYSSEDEKPLCNSNVSIKRSPRVILTKIVKKVSPVSKPIEVDFRITRSNKLLNSKVLRRQQIKQRLMTTPKTIIKARTLRSHTIKKRLPLETKLKHEKLKSVKADPQTAKKKIKSESPKPESKASVKKVEVVTKKPLEIIKKTMRKDTENASPKKEEKKPKQPVVEKLDSSQVLEIKKEILSKKKATVILKKSVPKPADTPICKKTVTQETELKTTQRPTRKTKEAAAIYMEILSHKLVESRIDDDNVSIDSFPELPNVKKTEQRENELKAKARSTKTSESELSSDSKKPKETESKILRSSEKKKSEDTKTVVKKILRSQDKALESCEKTKTEEAPVKKEIELVGRQTRNSVHNVRPVETDDSDESFRADVVVPRKKQLTRSKLKVCDENSEKKSLRTNARSYKECSSSESDRSTTSDVNLKQSKTFTKNKKFTKTRGQQRGEQSFSDSDEEPLSKLTQSKTIDTKESTPQESQEKKEESEFVKPKRECAKRPQNYLPMVSSSEEDETYFHVVTKQETKPVETKCSHAPTTSDLSCKDIGRRFGKGKVNMSNEQIEKWLKDSAMAGSSDTDAMLKFGENIPTETSCSVATSIDTERLKTLLTAGGEGRTVAEKKVEEVETGDKQGAVVKPAAAADRKLIFRTKEKGAVSSVKPFCVSNENSVYAFGEETEDVMKTPFRRPVRRPSSTATSRSEEESSRFEDGSKTGPFRKPPLVRQDSIKSAPPADDPSDDKPQTEQTKKLSLAQKIDKKPLPSTSMTPPSAGTLLKRATSRTSDSLDDFKYKVPSSPSASSSSSAKLYKRQTSKLKLKSDILPVKLPDFPAGGPLGQLVEAPTFYPTEKEFQDPLEYIEKIRLKAEQFGICRIVPPPAFKPECKVTDDMRFTAYNQYVHKMLHRWGPNFKELMAVKKYLSTQNISLTHPPWIGGMEIDLPRLYQTVQSLGGLKEVIEKKKWPKVSDAMKIPKSAQDRVTKLDDIYCKYLLPYDTLSPAEREKLFDEVETEWAKRESRSLLKAQQNPDSNPAQSDSESDDEAEECIVKGRNMALNAFYRIARNTMTMWFKTMEPPAEEVEQEFWKHVTLKQNHICVHSGSIDSGNWGYGFAVSKNSPFARHAWNLKVLTNNSGSVLRSMGPVMGVTVPTLHVGMVFSSCCWYRDPHSLPWIEYLHTGGNKIWYGIPNGTSAAFHAALKTLVPNYCRNKSLWLPSDTVMVPPHLLVENGVSLCRVVQEPGQFIVVFQKAFTSSLSTGYVVSESVYFAPPYWLKTGKTVFEELRNSCESSMFSFDRLLLSIVNDARSSVEVLKQIIPAVEELCDKERTMRERLKAMGVSACEKLPLPEQQVRRKRKLQMEDGEYECEVCRMNLFVSMVMESQEDAVYCLDHAADQIEKKKISSKHCKLSYTYDDQDLDGLVEKVQLAITNKLQKKIPNKFSGMPTLLNK